jgi:aryl-alcohol dehydrogenase-like predicted oxidoreductase
VGPQVAASLGRLGLPSADLFVFHGVSDLPAWRRLAAPAGPFAALGAEIRAGRARFRGVSSHHPDVLAEAIPSGLCDVVMLPIGPFADPRYEREILPLARAKGVGTIGFKAFGAGKLLADTEGYQRPIAGRPGSPASRDLPHLDVATCVRYAMTADPDVVLLGLSTPAEQDEAFEAAEAFREPLAPPALAGIRRRAARAIAGKGRVWWNPGP